MGITIHHTFMQTTERVKQTLDHGERVARDVKQQAKDAGIKVFVLRHSDTQLCVDIEGCETLDINFKRHGEVWSDWREEYGKQYKAFDHDPATSEHFKRWPGQVSLWSSGFTKTQYGNSVYCHVWVAEIVRAVASMCCVANVYDEGDYYHTRDASVAHKNIVESGKMIDKLAGAFTAQGWNIIKGGETNVRDTRKK